MYKVSCPDIGPAAVYRTIQLLNELDLICRKCGRVFYFQEDLLEELEAKITATTGFAVVNHEVKLYGYCKDCGK